MLDHLDDAVLILDGERTIRHMNPRARSLLEYGDDDEVGGRCRATTRGVDCQDACPLTFALNTGRGEAISDFAAVYRTSGGRQLPLRVTVVPLTDAEGAFCGAIEILRPAQPDYGFYLAGRSEVVQALRRRLRELAAAERHLALVGDAAVLLDVARAVHRFAQLDEQLFFAWAGSWDGISPWPPGTLFVPTSSPDGPFPDSVPDGWRLILGGPPEGWPGLDAAGTEVVRLPGARDRKEDLPHMVAAWIRQLSPGLRAEPVAIQKLARIACDRGLDGLQAIMSAAVASVGDVLRQEDIPVDGYCGELVDQVLARDNPFAALEEHLLKEVLDRCNWRMLEAADRLGISRVTLWRKLREHDLSRPEAAT